QLRHHQVGRRVDDRPDQEHDALAQQPAVDVVRTLTAARLLDDDRHHAQAGGLLNAHAADSINSLNASFLSTTCARPSTCCVTFDSTTTASTSAMRWRSDRYQRITSAGFS